MECESAHAKLASMELSAPISEIAKVRKGRGGALEWPLFVWDLIMEQLVIGVPPSAVWRSIASVVKQFSPNTTFKHAISLGTIRRARTVLLVVVQMLAACHLGKANKWGQLFHDTTLR